MEITSILGGKYVVVHPISLANHSYKDEKEFNIKFFDRLLPYCEKFNVKIALENVFYWNDKSKTVFPGPYATADEFIDYLDSRDSNYFTACLDIGHAEMEQCKSGSASTMILGLGDRLEALHIHDNNKIFDCHTLPFTRDINWDEIMLSLKKINYSGEFTFETDDFFNPLPTELYIPASKYMLEVGRYFIEKYGL